jgi:acyl carrier protein
MMNQQLLDFVYRVLEDFNAGEDSEDSKVPLALDTKLFGQGGLLDSLGLVNLIVLAEQKLEDDFGLSLSLADERAMSMESSPFATVESFVSYIGTLLTDSGTWPTSQPSS